MISHTIKEQVYEILKQSIVSGEYQMGEQLKELEIARKLNVSRSPVREAFRQLASDGLITNIANKGTYVKDVTEKNVNDIMDLRHIIEKMGIDNLKNLHDSRRYPLRRIRENMVRTFESGDYKAYSFCDYELHREITSYSDNEMIDLFSDQMYCIIQMYRNIALKNSARFQSSYKEHLDILDHLLAGDFEQAWALDLEHLRQTADEIKSYLLGKQEKYTGKVGLFGGAFDPIHRGHLQLCETMLQALKLDKILLIPSFRPIHKQDSIEASYADRLELCRLVTQGNPALVVDDVESRIYESGYFCDTLRHYKSYMDDVYLILGPDSFTSLSYWKDNDYIIHNATLCTAFGRNNPEVQQCSEHFKRMGGRIFLKQAELLPVSSSQVREDVKCYREYFPPPVYDYIQSKKLYRQDV